MWWNRVNPALAACCASSGGRDGRMATARRRMLERHHTIVFIGIPCRCQSTLPCKLQARNLTAKFCRCLALVAVLLAFSAMPTAQGRAATRKIPSFRVDAFWPKPLPNHWILGAVAGVAVDKHDHVWIVHRPSTLQPNETRSIWKAAPPVLEFDADGTLLSSWGGPGPGYEWPDLEHGIYIDHQDNVWLGGGGEKDAQLLKFTRQGSFLLQIGRKGRNEGSNDTRN